MAVSFSAAPLLQFPVGPSIDLLFKRLIKCSCKQESMLTCLIQTVSFCITAIEVLTLLHTCVPCTAYSGFNGPNYFLFRSENEQFHHGILYFAGIWSQQFIPVSCFLQRLDWFLYKRLQQPIKAFQDSHQSYSGCEDFKGQGSSYSVSIWSMSLQTWLLSTNTSWEHLRSTSQWDGKCSSRKWSENHRFEVLNGHVLSLKCKSWHILKTFRKTLSRRFIFI